MKNLSAVFKKYRIDIPLNLENGVGMTTVSKSSEKNWTEKRTQLLYKTAGPVKVKRYTCTRTKKKSRVTYKDSFKGHNVILHCILNPFPHDDTF